MTYISGIRLRIAMITGAVAGVGAGLVFATAHAAIIVPIWDRMFGGLAGAAAVGAVAGWSFVELHPEASAANVRRAATAGALFGAILWLVVSPVTAVDAVLRASGLPRNALADAVALVLGTSGGALFGWWRRRTVRAALAGAAATLLLTLAMGGPVPIANGPRALGIFLAVLPAAAAAGAILGTAIALTRPRARPTGQIMAS